MCMLNRPGKYAHHHHTFGHFSMILERCAKKRYVGRKYFFSRDATKQNKVPVNTTGHRFRACTTWHSTNIKRLNCACKVPKIPRRKLYQGKTVRPRAICMQSCLVQSSRAGGICVRCDEVQPSCRC
ncbi:unnamed protein product, partial [Ixodes persulcatus]